MCDSVPHHPRARVVKKAMNTKVSEQPQMGGTCGTLPRAPHMVDLPHMRGRPEEQWMHSFFQHEHVTCVEHLGSRCGTRPHIIARARVVKKQGIQRFLGGHTCVTDVWGPPTPGSHMCDR